MHSPILRESKLFRTADFGLLRVVLSAFLAVAGIVCSIFLELSKLDEDIAQARNWALGLLIVLVGGVSLAFWYMWE